ncbi:hypothetical protein GCM10011515_07520 [Tsuneonella deserti]|uniref:Uncharacterized protein n=1 Tax=Tsuneonella deserti TaxID=2035528 RepID=A0ABQ1S1Q1_9SPHN|nr:hypothetical protein [Tsuneonella deserti]GGD90417.1 hypothetical protein GCM10011515_07520 [Tsuneonella deserti]
MTGPAPSAVMPVASIDDVNVFTKSGVVIDRQADSETSVYGSVSGGRGRISSSTTEYLTLFLRDDEGNEFSVVLQDFSIPVRAGNRLTILFAGTRSSRAGRAAGILNHDTGVESICTATIEGLAPRSKAGCLLLVVVPILAFLALGTASRFALGILGDDSPIALLLAVAWLASPFVAFVVMLRRGRRETRVAGELRAQIRNLIQQRLDAARTAPPRSLGS